MRRVAPGDLDRLRAGHEDGSDIPDERLHHVAHRVIERVRRRDGFAFLAERSIKAADDLRLAEQSNQLLFERAREAEVVGDLEELVAIEPVRVGGCHGCHGLAFTSS
jgi:hypothetical protein